MYCFYLNIKLRRRSPCLGPDYGNLNSPTPSFNPSQSPSLFPLFLLTPHPFTYWILPTPSLTLSTISALVDNTALVVSMERLFGNFTNQRRATVTGNGVYGQILEWVSDFGELEEITFLEGFVIPDWVVIPRGICPWIDLENNVVLILASFKMWCGAVVMDFVGES